jgi:hypothetical protein
MPGFTFPPVGPLGLGSPPSRPFHYLGLRYYDPLRLPLLHLGSLRFRSIPDTLRAPAFVRLSPSGGGALLSAPGRSCIPVCPSRCPPQGDGGPLEFPDYPCVCMPRSRTPVVSSRLAMSSPGLVPSGAVKPSAFLGSRRVILSDHNYKTFGAQSRGLRTRYTWLHTHPCGLCMQVRCRFGGSPPLVGLARRAALTHWVISTNFTVSFPVPRFWV